MKSRLLYGVLIFASGLLAGYLFHGETAEISPHRHGYDVRERGGGYRFISPLIECADPWATTTSLTLMHRSLTTALEDMRQKADVPLLSVYVRDFDNGPWFGLHENTDFAPASLVKVPVMLAIYKAAETDPDLLTRRLRTPNPELVNPLARGAPSDMVQPDTEYTVQELMRSMIVKSDNLATQTILQHIPSEYVSDVFSHIGVPLEETGADVALSVKEYASFFRVLYNASFLTREYSEQALALLAETDFSYGIEAGLPSDIEVAHKWGVRTSTAQGEEAEQLHDCGIVYYPNHPYLLCVMTRGDDTLRQAQLIAEVSRVVHDEVTKSFSMPE